MYVPKLYREEDRAEIVAFLQQHNFPALVSFDGARPVATHLAVEVEATADRLTLYGHLARSNPQWRTFGAQEVLLIFQGPHTYISPRWYDHVNVPTWNYQMVHVYGTLRELAGADLQALLSRLVARHEAGSAYRLETLPLDFVQKQMAGVFGFAVDVTRLEAGYKLSQNRNDTDHANIVTHLDARADADSHAVAAAMRRQRAPRA
jgi:transcriptional regulator